MSFSPSPASPARTPYRKLPAPGQRPPAWLATLRKLHAKGYADHDIAVRLGADWSAWSVWYWRQRLNLPANTSHPRQQRERSVRLMRNNGQLRSSSQHCLTDLRRQCWCNYQAFRGWPPFLHYGPANLETGERRQIGSLSLREVQILNILFAAKEAKFAHSERGRRTLTRPEIIAELNRNDLDGSDEPRGLRRKLTSLTRGGRDYLGGLMKRGLVARAGALRIGLRRLTLYTLGEQVRPWCPETCRPRTMELRKRHRKKESAGR